MKLNIKVSEPNYLEIELVGEDMSMPNAIREILIEDKDVEFAACKSDHPQVGEPTIILRTKGKKALDVLAAAVDKLKKEAKEFGSELKAAKKSKK